MEVSRKKLRDQVLKRVQYVETCVLARELCLLVRTNRAVLEPKDVKDICLHISSLCEKYGCEEPSKSCRKAADAVGTADEEKYLEICAESCKKCGETRRPVPKTAKAPYVT